MADWNSKHPGYEAFFYWVKDNIPYLTAEEAAEVVDGLADRDMPPPPVYAMDELAKWASTASDNVEEVRENPWLRNDLRNYTEKWGLDEISENRMQGMQPSGGVYESPVYRAIRLESVDFASVAEIVYGNLDLEIFQHPAESWSLREMGARSFLGDNSSGVVLHQESPRPESLIWNFTNPVLGYDAFKSRFRHEAEVILESQCDSCKFEEIVQVNFGEVEDADVAYDDLRELEEALDYMGYSSNYTNEERIDDLSLFLNHGNRTYEIM